MTEKDEEDKELDFDQLNEALGDHTSPRDSLRKGMRKGSLMYNSDGEVEVVNNAYNPNDGSSPGFDGYGTPSSMRNSDGGAVLKTVGYDGKEPKFGNEISPIEFEINV